MLLPMLTPTCTVQHVQVDVSFWRRFSYCAALICLTYLVGTKGLAIVFVSSEQDEEVLKQIQSRFEVAIPELPESIDSSTYMS